MITFADVAAKDNQRALRAQRSIRRAGQPATLRQISSFGDAWAPIQQPVDMTITVVDLNERVRDNSGTLVGETRSTLLISTSAGSTIAKGDKIAVGKTKEEIAAMGDALQKQAFSEVAEVRPIAPGGTVIIWEVDLIT